MGILVEGVWRDEWYDTESAGGRFERKASQFRNWVTADEHYSGRVTVPVLWDKQGVTIVSNESADIIRMFNTAFNGVTGNSADYYPAELRRDIDAWNERIYPAVNNGVYNV